MGIKYDKNILLLFSHKLNEEQVIEAQMNYDINTFIKLPNDLQGLWSNIDPELKKLNEHLSPIKTFIKERTSSSDYVLIQGDYGACFIMINFCLPLGLIPVYATTRRNSIEEKQKDGKILKKSIFTFERFRNYEI